MANWPPKILGDLFSGHALRRHSKKVRQRGLCSLFRPVGNISSSQRWAFGRPRSLLVVANLRGAFLD